MIGLVLALVSAFGFALSSALQHHANHGVESGGGAGSHLMALLRTPRWVAGQVLALTSFVLHAVALQFGLLIVVQPVEVSGVVMAVPVRSALDRRWPSANETGVVAATAARSIEARRRAASTTVRDCGGSSPARCHDQLGIIRQSAGGAYIGRGVGPGAGSPWCVRIQRHAPNACSPVTFCSKTLLASASKTRSVAPIRRSGRLWWVAAMSGCRDASNPSGSSSAPHSRGS